jgi:hypothetical protein
MMTVEPARIRAMHPYAFRSGEWARILTSVEARGRDCWLVQFDDNDTDYWVKDDPHARYEYDTDQNPTSTPGMTRDYAVRRPWSCVTLRAP